MNSNRLLKTKNEAEKSQNDTSRPPETSKNVVKSPLFPCYLCGKSFYVPAIYDHEEECLKVWKEENEKLPFHLRKKIPQKEDVKFTPSGGVDFMGTFNRIWDNHLAELVPCRNCGRTFAPDRLEVHQRACKVGSVKKKDQGRPRK